jgi:ATP-dependent phosphofructokinase / diphosphate-dependent phosphofructokinase
LTATKGNVLVAQSGGGSCAINRSLVGVVRAALAAPDVDKVYGAWHGIIGVLGRVEQPWLDFGTVAAVTLEAVGNTPGPALGSCRYKVQAVDEQQVLARLVAANVCYFFYIGGNDSAATAHHIQQLADAKGYDLRVISVPKTIDNDLPITDHCPGYGSAARQLAIIAQDLDLDAWAMRTVEPVRLLIIKGRNSGWLAGAAALMRADERRGPHLIYLPERAFVEDRFLTDLEACVRRNGYVVAALAETVKDAAGQSPGASGGGYSDAFGHRYDTEGLGPYLKALVEQRLGLRARFDLPGSAQKTAMAYASQRDLTEAEMAGAAAVTAALAGARGQMVTLVRTADGDRYACATGLTDLANIAEQERTLPDEYINAAGNGVTAAFAAYALPLIASPADPLPRYATLRV